nr:hypothetical protein [Tanacetum cinerariifolium]
MGKDTVQLETAVNTISHEYLLEFTSEYGIPETLHPELPGPKDRIVDFPKGKVGVYTRFFEFATFRFPLSQFLFDVLADMDLFNLIRASNPTKVKTESRPRAPHEVPLPTLTASRVIEMDDPATATDSSGVPFTIERSSLDFSLEAGASDQGTVAPEMPPSEDVPATDVPGAGQAKETAAMDPPATLESRSSRRGKSLAAIQLGLASTVFVPKDAPAGVSDSDPLSVVDPPSRHPVDVAQVLLRRETRSLRMLLPLLRSGLLKVYTGPGGVVNGSLFDTPEACQDLVDHVAPLGYFSKPRHLHNDEFLRSYNVNLARQVAMGSQLLLRFEQEAKLLRKSVAQVAHRDTRIQARELEIKNLEALLEAETNTKKAMEDMSAGLSQELENMRAQFSDLQVSNERLSQQVATLQQQVSREEKLKATFEEFKRQQDDRVEQRCVEIDACLDALSIDFDKELYPHMLTAIAGR